MKTSMRKKIAALPLLGLCLSATVERVTAEEAVSYSSHIRPILEQRCLVCHGADAPEYKVFKKDKEKYLALMKGPRMDSYPHLLYFVGWPDTGALMRRLDDGSGRQDGKQGNMYQYLGDTDRERQRNLKLFQRWVGYWTLKRFPAVTKEELQKITVPY